MPKRPSFASSWITSRGQDALLEPVADLRHDLLADELPHRVADRLLLVVEQGVDREEVERVERGERVRRDGHEEEPPGAWRAKEGSTNFIEKWQCVARSLRSVDRPCTISRSPLRDLRCRCAPPRGRSRLSGSDHRVGPDVRHRRPGAEPRRDVARHGRASTRVRNVRQALPRCLLPARATGGAVCVSRRRFPPECSAFDRR